MHLGNTRSCGGGFFPFSYCWSPAGAAFYVATIPHPIPASALPAHEADAARGEVLFWAGGCYSCHEAADAPKGVPATAAELLLPGGKPFATPIGTFFPPNISPDKATGIGSWSTIDFVNAMKRGLSPRGEHLYPAFPYTSYQRMSLEDLIDLKAFLDTLPPVSAENRPHEIAFPYSLRRGIGLWKLAFLDGKEFHPDKAASDEVNRGAALVEGAGHCNECHTPRHLFGAIGLPALDALTGMGFLGGFDMNREFAGAPSLSGAGKRAPNITTGAGGIGDQSVDDLITAVEFGGGRMGGDMAEVRENLGKLDALAPDDLEAIFAYLYHVPPQDSARPLGRPLSRFRSATGAKGWGGALWRCCHSVAKPRNVGVSKPLSGNLRLPLGFAVLQEHIPSGPLPRLKAPVRFKIVSITPPAAQYPSECRQAFVAAFCEPS